MREIRVLPRGSCFSGEQERIVEKVTNQDAFLSGEQERIVEKVTNQDALACSLEEYLGIKPELLCSFVLGVLEGRGADQPGVLDDLNAMAPNLSLLVDLKIRKRNPEAAKEVQLRVLEALAKKTEA